MSTTINMQVSNDRLSLNFQLICFLILNLLLIGSSFFEQVEINDGLGWDGLKYGDITKHLMEYVSARSLDSYTIQRIIPSCIVYSTIKLFGLSFTNENVILIFSIYNIVLINISLLLWFRILQLFSFPKIVNIASLFLLLFNFCILKYSMYYPVLTDVSAFTLGMLLLYAYLKNNRVIILITFFLASFTHPLLQYFSILLFLFPKDANYKKLIRIPLIKLFPFAVCLLYAGIVLALYLLKPNIIDAHVWLLTDAVDKNLIFLSLLCTMTYLFIISRSLVKNKIFETALSSLHILRLLIVVAVFAITYLIRNSLSGSQPAFGIKNYVINIILQSISDPFEFLVSHFVYFGIAIMFIILYFKQYQKRITLMNIGFVIFIYLILFLAIGSESRTFVFAWPFLVLPVVFIINSLSVKRILPYIICSSILLSKIWLPVNLGAYHDNPTLYPDQYLFMSIGPWIIFENYLLQLAGIIMLLGIYLLLYYKKDKAISLETKKID
jgi:hypothetical protein